jgi:2-(1,2-epoxy-1,2-dihydrophenyl)acetyl-CoA isomerase
MSESRFASTSHQTLVCDVPRPAVGRVVLNRPDKMNAYTFTMTQELLAAVAAYRDDDALRALVITGAGGRAFCTGGDISGSEPEHSQKVRTQPMGAGREMREGMQAVVVALRSLDKPSVAMIRGYAVAGGLALAMACDFRFAATRAGPGCSPGRWVSIGRCG